MSKIFTSVFRNGTEGSEAVEFFVVQSSRFKVQSWGVFNFSYNLNKAEESS